MKCVKMQGRPGVTRSDTHPHVYKMSRISDTELLTGHDVHTVW